MSIHRGKPHSHTPLILRITGLVILFVVLPWIARLLFRIGAAYGDYIMWVGR